MIGKFVKFFDKISERKEPLFRNLNFLGRQSMSQSQSDSSPLTNENVLKNVAEETSTPSASKTSQQETQKDFDPSRHSADARWYIKCQILKMLKEGKYKKGEIARIFGVHRNTVSKISTLYKKNPNLSNDDLKEKHRGPWENPFRKIPFEVYAALCAILTSTLPVVFGLTYTTWSAKAILELLEVQYKLKIGLKYLYSFLAKMNISSKFAERFNPKRDDQEVSAFTTKRYRKICLRAMQKGREILFADEVHVQCGNHVRGFAPIGEPAIMAYDNSSMHSCLSLLVFIGLNGFIRIFEINGSFTAEDFKKCLKQIKNENPEKKFQIFLDNSRVHHAKIVKKWLKHYRGGKSVMKIDFIPAYCPELNPTERWNNVFKEHMKKHFCKNEAEVKEVAMQFIKPYNNGLQGDQVKNLFKDERCSYSITEAEKAKKIYTRYLILTKKVA